MIILSILSNYSFMRHNKENKIIKEQRGLKLQNRLLFNSFFLHVFLMTLCRINLTSEINQITHPPLFLY